VRRREVYLLLRSLTNPAVVKYMCAKTMKEVRVLMTSGHLTNAVKAKVARKVVENTWNGSTMMTHSGNSTYTLHISSDRSIIVGKIHQYVPSPCRKY